MSEMNRAAMGKLPTTLKKAVYIALHSPVAIEFMQCFYDVSTVDMSRITTLSNDCLRFAPVLSGCGELTRWNRRQRVRLGIEEWPFMDIRRGFERSDGLTWERIAAHRIRFMNSVRVRSKFFLCVSSCLPIILTGYHLVPCH